MDSGLKIPGTLGADAWVVASNAPTKIKNFASYLQNTGYPVFVCDGVSDQTEINSTLSSYSSVLLSGGTFNCNAAITPVSGNRLLGMGKNSTIINFSVAALYINNVDNVEIGNFKVTGTGSVSYYGGIFINCTANHEKFYVHDIWSTILSDAVADPVASFCINVSGNFTMSKVLFERCFADSPDWHGFAIDGDGAVPKFNDVVFSQCRVKNAGIAATRYNPGSGSYECGYNLAVTNAVSLTDVVLTHCIVDGAWEVGYYVETESSITNLNFIACTAKNCGQKAPAPTYGSGFLLNNGDVNLIDCIDYGSYLGILFTPSGSANIHLINFKTFNSVYIGVEMGNGAAGDRITFTGGGAYNSGNLAIQLGTPAANGYTFDGFEVINATGDATRVTYLNCTELVVRNCYVRSDSKHGFYMGSGTNPIFQNNRIITTTSGNPISVANVNVVNALIMGNNWNGSANDITTAGATTPKIHDNLDKTGAWFAET